MNELEDDELYCLLQFGFNNKNRSPSLPTLVGGANGGSEIVKMWKDYFKEILKSESSANESAEYVDHSIDCKKNYLEL